MAHLQANMEEKYSIIDYTHIHLMYVKANGNALEAARLYAEAFPNRRHPDSRPFTRIHQRLRESGSFRHQERPGRPKTLAPDVEESVLERVDVNPGTSCYTRGNNCKQCMANLTSPVTVPIPYPTCSRSQEHRLPS